MKFYGKEIPADIEIPELDGDALAELEPLQHLFISAQPAIDIDALRSLPPRARAILLCVHREHVTD